MGSREMDRQRVISAACAAALLLVVACGAPPTAGDAAPPVAGAPVPVAHSRVILSGGLASRPADPEGLTQVVSYFTHEDFAGRSSSSGCVLFMPDGVDLRYRPADANGRLLKEQGAVDGIGRKQGPWIEWDVSQDLWESGAYVDGVRVGRWVVWHRNHVSKKDSLIMIRDY